MRRFHERSRRGPRRLLADGALPRETGTVTAIVSAGVDITMRRKRERGSSVSETCRRQCSRRFRASWSCSHATARSAIATPTTRVSAEPRVPPRARLAGLGAGRSPFLDLVVDDDEGRAARAIASAAEGIPSEEIESELRPRRVIGVPSRGPPSPLPMSRVGPTARSRVGDGRHRAPTARGREGA